MPEISLAVIVLTFVSYFIYVLVWTTNEINSFMDRFFQRVENEDPRASWDPIMNPDGSIWVKWLTIPLVAIVVVFSCFLDSGALAFLTITLAITAAALVLGTALSSYILKAHLRVLSNEGGKVLHSGKGAVVSSFLVALLGHKKRAYRELAIHFMKMWGSIASMRNLHSPDIHLTPDSLKKAKQVSKEIRDGITQMTWDHWNGVRILTGTWIYWQRLQASAAGKDDPKILKAFLANKHAPNEIKKFFARQKELHQHFPHVYHEKERRKAVVKKINGGEFVRCPATMETEGMIFPVKTVRGEIGGKGASRLEDGVLTLPLWDDENNRVHIAEVDEVIIHPIDQIDWAVAATLEKLENEHPRPLPKLLIGAGVTLNPNSEEIIKNYGKQNE